LAITRAVLTDPQPELAEEPTGNLDQAAGQQVLAWLAELTADGTTVAVVTHDRDIATRLGRRVELRDGRMIADTSPTAASQPQEATR